MSKNYSFSFLSGVLILSLALFSACSSPKASLSRPVDSQQYYTHTVASQGETLATIAKWYTGSAKNWTTVLNYNPGLDVRRIRIGTQIRIPETLLVKRTPMPKSAIIVASEKPAVSPRSEEPAPISASENSDLAANAPAFVQDSQEQGSISPPDTSEVVEQTNDITQETIVVESNNFPQDDAPQDKSFLSKLQEGALKAQEAALKVGNKDGTTSKPDQSDGVSVVDKNANPVAVAPSQEAPSEAIKKELIAEEELNAAAQIQAKAAQDAANAQIKAAEEQVKAAQEAAAQAGQSPQQPRVKTRDELLKELTEDY